MSDPQAQAAGQLCSQVGQNVAKHVGGHDDIEPSRIADHVRHHGIDDLVVDFNLGKIFSNPVARVQENTVGDLEHIVLMHQGETPAPLHGDLERTSGDALAARARDATKGNRHIRGDQELAVAGFDVAVSVKPFGVFAHHHQVERAADGWNARKRASRPDVGEQIEPLSKKL